MSEESTGGHDAAPAERDREPEPTAGDPMRFVWILAAYTLLGGVGCSNPQSAAARDPLKCERDPSCAKARGSYADCTRQCADAPECMQRCEQIQKQIDSMGR
jgi:hypothetical protein